MEFLDNKEGIYEFKRPGLSFVLVLLMSFIIFSFIGPFIGILFAVPFMEFSLMESLEAFSPPFDDARAKVPLFIIQGVASALGFIVFPLIYLKAVQKKKFSVLFGKQTQPILWVNTILIVIAFMVVNSIFIEWNMGVRFPEALSGLERIARQLESQAEELTHFLTSFDNSGQFILAMFVIAVIPAIGEELVFRGLLQRMAHQSFKNIHIAIWVSAIIFSTFHLQFYGFLPRLLLGVLFGYMMFWSGTLWIPILAHFVNNSFTLVMVYLHNTGQINFDIENTDSVSIPTVLIFTLITSFLLFIFYRTGTKNQAGEVA